MTALYLTKDLFFSSRITSTAATLGLQMQVVTSSTQLLEQVQGGDVQLVLLEFSLPGINLVELVPSLRAASPTTLNIIAFGPHVDVAGLAGAKQAGCNDVYTRGQFSQQMTEILRQHGCVA